MALPENQRRQCGRLFLLIGGLDLIGCLSAICCLRQAQKAPLTRSACWLAVLATLWLGPTTYAFADASILDFTGGGVSVGEPDQLIFFDSEAGDEDGDGIPDGATIMILAHGLDSDGSEGTVTSSTQGIGVSSGNTIGVNDVGGTPTSELLELFFAEPESPENIVSKNDLTARPLGQVNITIDNLNGDGDVTPEADEEFALVGVHVLDDPDTIPNEERTVWFLIGGDGIGARTDEILTIQRGDLSLNTGGGDGMSEATAFLVDMTGRTGDAFVDGKFFHIDFLADVPTVSSYRLVSAIVDITNEAPEANAGADQPVRAGETAFLDGSASFDDNTDSANLIYSWSITDKPVGSMATLDDPSSITPSFIADLLGTYVVELVVTDEGGLSSPDPVNDDGKVEISSDNLAPTAAAGNNRLVVIGDTVFLDGFGSTDPEDDPLTYSWTMVSPATSIAVLSGADTAFPSFVPDVLGDYQLSLVVSDFIGPGTADSVLIFATTAQGFAEIQILTASETFADLAAGEVTNQGNQQALLNFLRQAVLATLTNDLEEAIDKLEKAIRRTDGCALNDPPAADGNGPSRDWITDDPDCAVQLEIYDLLNQALDALTPATELQPV